MSSLELNEEEWWDRYGRLQERIWQYDDRLTKLVREKYLGDMEQFLFVPGGRILDFGCGTGWVGLRLAQKGMLLEGIDISGEQIAQARKNAAKAGVPYAHFIQGGVEKIPTQPSYNSVLLHSLLHHLSEYEIQHLFARISDALIDGGRIYAYEPAAAKPNPPLEAWVLDKFLLLLLRVLRIAFFYLRLQDPCIYQALRAGWSLKSPGEAPLDLTRLHLFLPKGLEIREITYWHMCSVAYANLCMGLRPFWRNTLSLLTPCFVKLDRLILRTPWRVYFRAWPMVTIKIEKAH